MSLLSNIQGIFASFFQVGGNTGPGLNANSGALEARNAANSAYANARGADPIVADDLVTKRYGDANYSGGSSKPAALPWYMS